MIEFGGTLAAVIVDAKSCTFKGVSPSVSNYAISGGVLRATAMTNLRVHVLGETAATTRGARFNTREHLLNGGPSDGNPDNIFGNGFDRAQSNQFQMLGINVEKTLGLGLGKTFKNEKDALAGVKGMSSVDQGNAFIRGLEKQFGGMGKDNVGRRKRDEAGVRGRG